MSCITGFGQGQDLFSYVHEDGSPMTYNEILLAERKRIPLKEARSITHFMHEYESPHGHGPRSEHSTLTRKEQRAQMRKARITGEVNSNVK